MKKNSYEIKWTAIRKMTTLRDLSSSNSLDEVTIFLQRTDIEYNDLYHALWDAVRYGYYEMVDTLLKDERIRAIAADKENGCLLKAVEYGYTNIVRLLLQIPDVAKNKDTQRKSALLMAKLKCDQELIAILA